MGTMVRYILENEFSDSSILECDQCHSKEESTRYVLPNGQILCAECKRANEKRELEAKIIRKFKEMEVSNEQATASRTNFKGTKALR